MLKSISGTRCDQYTYKLITGKDRLVSCHYNLTEAVKVYGLKEEDVHDVFNVFMATGWTKNTHQYVSKGTPAVPGDYIGMIAEMDLILALSACPQGDVSIPCGVDVPEEHCHPMQVDVFRANP